VLTPVKTEPLAYHHQLVAFPAFVEEQVHPERSVRVRPAHLAVYAVSSRQPSSHRAAHKLPRSWQFLARLRGPYRYPVARYRLAALGRAPSSGAQLPAWTSSHAPCAEAGRRPGRRGRDSPAASIVRLAGPGGVGLGPGIISWMQGSEPPQPLLSEPLSEGSWAPHVPSQ
jgi:hypothetical protein